jgi:hypothetical protein
MRESVTTAQERVQQGSKAMFGLEPIIFWGWLFFILYMGLMVGFGFIACCACKIATISPPPIEAMDQCF